MEFETIGSPWAWVGFVAFVLAMLAVDLGIFHRKAHAVGFREALAWSAVWITLSLLFNALVWWAFGADRGLEFLTGYLIEKSLSVDNIFVFVVIFAAMRIPAIHQHRVLFWGIASALVLRAAMIFAGTAMLARFHWLIYALGVFLILTGAKLFFQRGKELHPEDSWAMRLARRLIPSTSRLDGNRFFTRDGDRRVATPLFMSLLLVEVTDVVFAVDSIPAIFAITVDPFIVFTSNIFAILGLRSLFFLVAGLVDKFKYLKVGLAAVLAFVGAKMTLASLYPISPLASLVVIVAILGASMIASIQSSQARDAS
ncbi:MAG: TerC family protein [Planctomycetes bacterium]|nr:TerC family protein [Planctomycetota bacterium]MBI3847832.1 TerC family protein [Planctomycetota bacterium]